MWRSSLVALLYGVALSSLLSVGVTAQSLSFNPVTARAQWIPRQSAGLEMTGTSVSVGSRTYPPGSMVLWGGASDGSPLTDTWVSSDGLQWGRLSPTTPSLGPAVGAAFCRDSQYRLFQIGGERDGEVINEVWMSETTGRSWIKQTATTTARALPARAYLDVAADSADNLFAVGGRDGGGGTGDGYNDVYRSVNQGKDWVRRTALPTGPGGRFSATLLISYSKILRVDIMTYMAGIGREGGDATFYNDIWVSSNQAQTWTLLTDEAPFNVRDNFNAEVTPEGYLLVESGYNYQETYNDVSAHNNTTQHTTHKQDTPLPSICLLMHLVCLWCGVWLSDGFPPMVATLGAPALRTLLSRTAASK